VRIFKTRAFGRFARKERIGDALLCEAIERAERGFVDADLGGHVIKQRVARPGQGRSGGYRTLIAYRSKTRAVFLFGFAKNDQDNIDDDELKELRKAAAEMLSWSGDEVAALVAGGKWMEIDRDDQDL
jgi:hypothetical protein